MRRARCPLLRRGRGGGGPCAAWWRGRGWTRCVGRPLPTPSAPPSPAPQGKESRLLLADAKAQEQPVEHLLGVDLPQQTLERQRGLAQMLGGDLVGGAVGNEAV